MENNFVHLFVVMGNHFCLFNFMDIPEVCQDWVLVIGLEAKRESGGSCCRGSAVPIQTNSTGESKIGFLGRGG